MKSKSKVLEKEKREFYEHRPNREFKASLSKDGKYWIFKDITTHIVPKEYLDKVNINSANDSDRESSGGTQKMDV